VWVTKYRYKVLVGDLGRRVKDLVQEVSQDNAAQIIRGTIGSNHVHIYVSLPPYQSISKYVQLMKGKSSRKIQQEFPEIRKRYWGKHLWASGYFVRTSGNVTDQMIKDYIGKHKSEDDNFGDFKVEN
jgi:putative transposase